MPCGEILNFERDGVTYRLVRDASGSVRLVAGTEVMVSLDYDPSGNLLSALLPARPPSDLAGIPRELQDFG